MFRVKICGVTSVEDALLACDAGADAIGLNFCSSSPRHCTLAIAKQIAAAVPKHVCKVGVFVNESAERIREIAASVSLDVVQLHGEESPEFARTIRPLPYIKALASNNNLTPVAEYLEQCHRQQAMPRMVLLDAARNGQFGGTGQTIDWDVVRQNRAKLSGVPLILAGGLKPENIAQAIAAVHPWGVDVASGVESSPGTKSADRVRQFVELAKIALSAAQYRG